MNEIVCDRRELIGMTPFTVRIRSQWRKEPLETDDGEYGIKQVCVRLFR